jgi:peptidoglycan glycosyltransferase
VVLMDAETGAVLALVSHPAYDPEPLFVAPNAGDEAIGDAVDYWEQLESSEDGRLVLRPTQGQYVSGSVFKTLVAAAMIDSGRAQPDTVFRDEGALTVDSRVIIEENRPDPNKIDYTLAESYAYSLNVVFAQVGLQLGPDVLEDYARRFGFGETIPFDLSVLPSSLANDPAFIENPAGLAETAFGQGQLLVTPLQMALIVQAVVNDGEMMAPYLLQQVTDETGKVLTDHTSQVWKQPISADTAAKLQEMMIGSVEFGYASGAQMPGYVVGGKTGTAEVGDLTPHAWFTGFAGAEEPEYVVSVIVENGGSGGEVALPIGRELLRSAIERSVE